MEKRFIYNDMEFHIIIKSYHIDDFIIGEPSLSISKKTSKKVRSKKLSTGNHYALLGINDIKLSIKLYKIFYDLLKNFNYICWYPYEEHKYKRERVFRKAFERMGFKSLYNFNTWNFMAKPGHKLKKKTIIKYINNIYYDQTR